LEGAACDLEVASLRPLPAERLEVVADRLVARASERARLAEGLETALRAGDGFASVVAADSGQRLEITTRNLCATCRIELPELSPGLFSFNQPDRRLPGMPWLRQPARVRRAAHHPRSRALDRGWRRGALGDAEVRVLQAQARRLVSSQ
jgi:hypothetical protein